MITVAICTRNRAESLGQTLASLSQCEPPQGRLDVLIIDNGSTDHTAGTVSEFNDRLSLRRVVEEEPGLSYARNRAIREAAGEFLIWTDDDVLLSQQWLKAYEEAFARYPDAALFGGPIRPRFLDAPPAWFSVNDDLLGSAIARLDLGATAGPLDLDTDRLPFGANFATKLSEQRRFLFDPGLGVAPKRRRLGEETQVFHAMLKCGLPGRWVPEAGVEHRIPGARLSYAHIRDHHRAIGETWAYLSDTIGDNPFGGPLHRQSGEFLKAPLWVWRRAILGALRQIGSFKQLSSRQSVQSLQDSGYYRGALEYWVRGALTGAGGG